MVEAREMGWLSKDDAASFSAGITDVISELEAKSAILDAQADALRKRADAFAESAKRERAAADAMASRADGMRDSIAVAIKSAEGYVAAARTSIEKNEEEEG